MPEKKVTKKADSAERASTSSKRSVASAGRAGTASTKKVDSTRYVGAATKKTTRRRPRKANRSLAIPGSGLEPRRTRAMAVQELQELPQPVRGDAINLGPVAGTGSPTGTLGAGGTDLCEIS